MCALTSYLLVHKSQFHNRLCALCAEICAEDCARIGQMDVAACSSVATLCSEVVRLDRSASLTIASSMPPGR